MQERLAAQKQKQQGAAGGEGGGGDGAAGQARGKHEAALAAEAVRQLREQCDAAAAAVREAAEAREDEQREAWEQQGAWLKGEIATEAESCRQHNRAIDLEWEGVHNATTPQAAHDAMLAVRAHCDQVCRSLVGGCVRGGCRCRHGVASRAAPFPSAGQLSPGPPLTSTASSAAC